MSKTFIVWGFDKSANDLESLLSEGIKNAECQFTQDRRINVTYMDSKAWTIFRKNFKVSGFKGNPEDLAGLLCDGLPMVCCELNSRGGLAVRYGTDDEVQERERGVPRSSSQKAEADQIRRQQEAQYASDIELREQGQQWELDDR